MVDKVKDLEIYGRYRKMANCGLWLAIPGTLIVLGALVFLSYLVAYPDFTLPNNKILDFMGLHTIELVIFLSVIGFGLSGFGILLGNRARRLMPPEFAPIRAWIAIAIGGLGAIFLVIIFWLIKTVLKETIRSRPDQTLMGTVGSYFNH